MKNVALSEMGFSVWHMHKHIEL